MPESRDRRESQATRSEAALAHPYEPRAGVPDAAMVDRLLWPDRWMSADHVIRPLRFIKTGHLWAVAGYLRWYADWLGEHDPTAAEGESVGDYLRSRPIWIGIECELARRGQIAISLYETLRERGGLVPWEAWVS